MASLSIFALASFFADEHKSIDRGENHVKSNHVRSLTYSAGILRGECDASMEKKKTYKVMVSEKKLRLAGLIELAFVFDRVRNFYSIFNLALLNSPLQKLPGRAGYQGAAVDWEWFG